MWTSALAFWAIFLTQLQSQYMLFTLLDSLVWLDFSSEISKNHKSNHRYLVSDPSENTLNFLALSMLLTKEISFMNCIILGVNWPCLSTQSFWHTDGWAWPRSVEVFCISISSWWLTSSGLLVRTLDTYTRWGNRMMVALYTFGQSSFDLVCFKMLPFWFNLSWISGLFRFSNRFNSLCILNFLKSNYYCSVVHSILSLS